MAEQTHEIRPDGFVCCCGQSVHISVFHEALRAAAAEGYRLGRLTQEMAEMEAVSAAYRAVARSHIAESAK